jgi:nucleoside-diphosphate-sugar epimerase
MVQVMGSTGFLGRYVVNKLGRVGTQVRSVLTVYILGYWYFQHVCASCLHKTKARVLNADRSLRPQDLVQYRAHENSKAINKILFNGFTARRRFR